MYRRTQKQEKEDVEIRKERDTDLYRMYFGVASNHERSAYLKISTRDSIPHNEEGGVGRGEWGGGSGEGRGLL